MSVPAPGTVGTDQRREDQAKQQVLTGGGEVGELMRRIDWSQTPLGPVQGWPQSLRTSVSICMHSRFELFIWWGPQLTMVYNDAYRQTLASKHPFAMGKPGQVVWPEIWDIIGPMLRRVMETGEATWSDDLRLILERHGYPEETYHTFSYSPILDESGGVGGVFTAVSQTTEKVIGERRLRTLRDLAARAVDMKNESDAWKTAADVIGENNHDVAFSVLFRLSDDGHVLSPAAWAGIGVDHPFCAQAIHLEDSNHQFGSFLRQAITEGKPVEVQNADQMGVLLPGGAWSVPPRELMLVPLSQTGQAQPLGVLMAGVSRRKLLDDSYRTFFKLMAGQIAKGVADAQAFESERRRAEALAELDRAKTAFFSNVSHEFRTPLTLMLGPLEDTLQGPSDLPIKDLENLTVVHRNGLRLMKLVNTLLDFSRIEAGRVQAVYQPTDLAATTAELASVFRSAVERAGMELMVDCEAIAEPVYVDRDMWEKIVLNLLSNAFKFTFDGSIKVALRDSDDHVRLTVQDTGTGIPATEIPRLFERFHRVEGTRGRTFEGTGIGLALVQELAKLHGGSVWVESDFGRGTTFTVEIPKGKTHLPAERIESSCTLVPSALRADSYVEEAMRWLPEATGDMATPIKSERELASLVHRREQGRIVLADDNADMRDYVRRLLEQHYDVTAVVNGKEALETTLQDPPDLILSDIMMPVMDGFGLLHSVRENPQIASIPVILLSARAGEESRVEGLQAGADDYLVKPFTARELLARVGAHLSMAKSRREAASRERVLREEAVVARQQAERRERLLKVAQRAANAGSFEWNIESGEMEWTEDFFEIHAVPAGTKPSYETWARLVHPEDLQRAEGRLQDAITGRHDILVDEYRIITPDGSVRWISSHGRLFYDGSGKALRMVGISIDVTQRKRAEDALRRTEKLAATGRLAASIAHEINNPLEAVTNLLYLISSDRSLEEQSKTYLDLAQREIARVSDIATQTLRFYRQTSAPTLARIPELLDSVLGVYQSRMLSTEISVVKEYLPVRELRCLAGEIRQVLANLIGNALDAMDRRGTLRLRIHDGRDWNGSGEQGVRIAIADTGSGIDPRVLPHIFEAFVTTKETTGTGLGLWVSSEIMKKHGGQMRVRSSSNHKNRGTVFTLFLPYTAKALTAEGAA